MKSLLARAGLVCVAMRSTRKAVTLAYLYGQAAAYPHRVITPAVRFAYERLPLREVGPIRLWFGEMTVVAARRSSTAAVARVDAADRRPRRRTGNTCSARHGRRGPQDAHSSGRPAVHRSQARRVAVRRHHPRRSPRRSRIGPARRSRGRRLGARRPRPVLAGRRRASRDGRGDPGRPPAAGLGVLRDVRRHARRCSGHQGRTGPSGPSLSRCDDGAGERGISGRRATSTSTGAASLRTRSRPSQDGTAFSTTGSWHSRPKPSQSSRVVRTPISRSWSARSSPRSSSWPSRLLRGFTTSARGQPFTRPKRGSPEGRCDAVPGPVVFLDRDGVVNEPVRWGSGERPPWSLDELKVVAGARCAVTALRAVGFGIVLVTNQPDVGHGRLDLETAREINSAVATAVGTDRDYLCPHTNSDDCPCRKPRPGMLVRAAAELAADLSKSWMIGDRWVDVAAGSAAGIRTILLSRDVSWRPTSAGGPAVGLRPTAVAPTVGAAADIILAECQQGE